ncbi:RNA polymerase sigma factor [uncultured Microscilla sp.]|uniref:RNA polymerase sigma factor n=1 Tax=uncultured Microscilla sp. TaxID=432653 RepID=UPI00262B076E|nr:RNA polymerase sigma-70 factor [uncultured Microscilla sp.]
MQKTKLTPSDAELLTWLKKGNEKVIQILFDTFYVSLCKTVNRIVHNTTITEDIVQDVFLKIWQKRGDLNIQISLKAYLHKMAINAALSHLRKKYNTSSIDDASPQQISKHAFKEVATEKMEFKELEHQVNEAINELPPKCREVFILSRYEELSYKEIAQQMGISPKTVENQMSKALKHLRKKLAAYIKNILLFLAPYAIWEYFL